MTFKRSQEDGVFMMGLVLFIRRVRGQSPALSLPREDVEAGRHLHTGRRALTARAGILIADFPASRIERNRCLLSKPPRLGCLVLTA